MTIGNYVTADIVSNMAMRGTALPCCFLLIAGCASASLPGGPASSRPDRARPTPALSVPGLDPRPDEARVAYDADGDGKPDRWKVTRNGAAGETVRVRVEKDLDGDGRPDTWELYGPDGALEVLAYDLDLDGRPDTALTFEAGRLVRKEQVSGLGDGARTVERFEDGRLVSRERTEDRDGKPGVLERWRDGEPQRAGTGAAPGAQK